MEPFIFKDPHKGMPLTLTISKVKDLEVIRHQRKPSPGHINRLAESIRHVGFIVPLIAVEKNKEGKLVIIDGQHRLLAAKQVGIDKLPVIVVPAETARKMMDFNIEKELNLRERTYVAHSLFREFIETRPELLESDGLVADSIGQAYYVTLGIAYREQEKLTGSSFEPILKKCDFFLDEKVKTAYMIREGRAGRVKEAYLIAKEITAELKERGLWNPYLSRQVISAANPYKRRRLPADFDDLFRLMIEKLHELSEHPERVLRERVGV